MDRAGLFRRNCPCHADRCAQPLRSGNALGGCSESEGEKAESKGLVGCETPSTKIQAPENLQKPSSKDFGPRLRFGAGCFSGAWILVLGCYSVFGGISPAAFTISSNNLLKSSKPGAGMIIVSRRPPTSSVIRKNRPRGFSLCADTKVFRSIWTLSDLMVSSVTGGLDDP